MPKSSVPKRSPAPVQRVPKTPVLPPPLGFEYQAFGFLAGELTASDEGYALRVDDQLLTLSGCNDRLLRWLNTQELPLTGYFGLYPKSTRGGTTFWLKSFEAATSAIETGVFNVDGQLVSTNGAQQLLRIHRNQLNSIEKPFFIKVSGFLPESKLGQFWELECLWEDEKFSLLDGRRFEL